MKSSLPSERKSRLSELSAKLTQPHSSARARLAQEREAPDWPTALPGGTVFAEPVGMCFPALMSLSAKPEGMGVIYD